MCIYICIYIYVYKYCQKITINNLDAYMHTCMPVNNYTYTVIYVSTSYMSTVFIFIMAQQLSPSTKLLKVKAMTMRRENLAMGDLMGFMGYGKYLYIYFIRITHYNHQCDIYDIL